MFDVIIVGGGAAGFYAAIHIAENSPSSKIAIFERGKTVLGKVKVSGGGRCNVTHAEFDPRQLTTNYPRGERELLGPFHQYMTGDVFAFFEQRGVPLKIEGDGRVFPQSNSSQTIIDCFLGEIKRLNIDVLKNSSVKNFEYLEAEKCWKITTQNKHYFSKKLLLATGSNTKVWDKLAVMGHSIVKPVASLFTFNIKDDRLKNNQGISIEAEINVLPAEKYVDCQQSVNTNTSKTEDLSSSGPILITHWGLSGPAVLKLSAWGAILLNSYEYKFQIKVNWAPEYNYESMVGMLNEVKSQSPKKTIHRTKALAIPRRFWMSLCRATDINEHLKWADTSKETLQKLAAQLTEGIYSVNGKSTFKEEFVTAGGVDLKEIDFKTFKSRKLPNLFFAGEIINVDAITGGFNFQNAWTGAYLAAKAISQDLA